VSAPIRPAVAAGLAMLTRKPARWTRRHGKAVARGAVTTAAVLALTLSVGVTPSIASPTLLAQRQAEKTLAEVRNAADKTQLAPTEPAPVADPVGEGTITPNQTSTVTAQDPDVEVTFSGHEIDEKLDVDITPLSKAVATSAETETGGTAVGTPVDISATTDSGGEVTTFPADATLTDQADGTQVATDVVPGVALEMAVTDKQIKGLDPSSLQIYTRENAGDPWVALPSVYDEDARVVRGESGHLSQMVVIGIPFIAPPGPKIVLDPDDDLAYVTQPAPELHELPLNIQLAQQVKQRLETNCRADVTITREDPNTPIVSTQLRADIAAAANPDATITVAFDAIHTDEAWDADGTESGGRVYYRSNPQDQALGDTVLSTMPAYVQRPFKAGNLSHLPAPEFNNVPGAYTHFETLFLDSNYDRAYIDDPEGFAFISAGVTASLSVYLADRFNCIDPATGGLPGRPTQAQLDHWRDIGYQNYEMYGAEPVSFSTGNLIEAAPLFKLSGPGNSDLDLNLIYNSLDGRDSRIGTGWSFAFGARAQRYEDGSVLVVRNDGATFDFSSDGSGGYIGEPGLFQTLTNDGNNQLTLTAVDGESWVFDAADIDGVGELVKHTDQQGNATTLTYGATDWRVNKFAPLQSITDAAGQTITVSSDAVGRLTSFTHPDGRTWSLGYDANTNLTSITNPDGRVRSYSYDDAHRMVTATDALGVTYLTNEFDAEGRVAKQTDADGNVRSLSYDTASGTTTYTDNEGTETVFSYDSQHRITGKTDAAGNSTAYVYNDLDQVTSYTDEAGHEWAYTYDATGNVASTVLPDGTTTTFTYTPTGELASQTDEGGPDGAERTTTYQVDPLGLVTGITQADGTELARTYDGQGNLTSSTTPSGATTTYAYDSRGNVAALTDPNGNVTTFVYDGANRVTSKTDPTGATTTLAWDAGDRLVSKTDAMGGVTSYTYDANDNLTSSTDAAGAVTSYAWNNAFNLVAVADPDGGTTNYEYNTEDELTKTTDPLGNVTSFVLDDLYRPVTVVDPKGGEWVREYDEVGNLVSQADPAGAETTYVYDELNRATKVTGPTGITSSTSYDEVGRVNTSTDAEGNSVSYVYDLLDRITNVTDQQGETSTFIYDVDSNLVASTDRRGNQTTLSYDASGQLTGSIDPSGAATQLVYDPAGRVQEQIDALGRSSTVSYDPLGRVTAATNPLGDTTSYGYDAVSRLTAITDANGNTSTTVYNPTGTVASTTNAVGSTTTYGYDLNSQQTSMVDANGNETRYSYDPAGQLAKVIEGFDANVDAAATGTSDVNVTTVYDWTETGNLASILDPNGHKTLFDYNSAGQVTSETNPLGKSWDYSYDSLGRLSSQIDGNRQTTNYSYTSRSDLAQVSYPGSSVQFEYDANQQPIAMTDPLGVTGWKYDANGLMTEQIDANGSRLGYTYDAAQQLSALTVPTGERIGYEYDDAGRPVAQTSPWGNIAYEWDPAGNLTTMLRSTGVATDYGYDAANRVTQIQHIAPASPSDPNAAPAATVAPEAAAVKPVTTEVEQCVTAAGYLGKRAIPAAGSTSHECVKTGDYLERRTVPALPNPVENVDTITFDYTYDPAGNVSNATRTLGALDDPTAPDTGSTPDAGAAPSVTAPDPTPAFPSVLETPDVDSRDYAYDSLNRLVGSETSKGNTAEYAYDPAGNRVQATTTTDAGTTDVTASFNEANQLTGSTSNGASSSYGYDGNGNRTSQNENGVTTDFTYQTDNRLTGVSRDGRSSSYAYDGLGRRLNTTETSSLGSQTTKSVWDGTSIVQQSDPASGTSTLMRDAFGEVALQTADGKDASWALLDSLGTTAAQAVGGSVAQLSTFDDWGNQSFDTIGWNSTVNYTGETTDPGYGLNNYYSRTYDPTTGFWMSQDSWRGLLGAPQTLGRYAYVTNNPVSSQDLLGYMSPDSMEKHANANNCTFVSMTECGRVTTAPPSIRVIEDYASDGGPHLPETWEDTDYVFGPSGETVEIPARHVQGFDEGFPGYQPAVEPKCKGSGKFQVCTDRGGFNPDIVGCFDNALTSIACDALLAIATLGLVKGTGKGGAAGTGPAVMTTAEEATVAQLLAKEANGSHVFVDKHGLGGLVAELGSEKAVVEEVVLALRSAGLKGAGIYEVDVVIRGQTVHVQGNQIGGKVYVGDFWVPTS
jgi:RHS repeat-associated protein